MPIDGIVLGICLGICIPLYWDLYWDSYCNFYFYSIELGFVLGFLFYIGISIFVWYWIEIGIQHGIPICNLYFYDHCSPDCHYHHWCYCLLLLLMILMTLLLLLMLPLVVVNGSSLLLSSTVQFKAKLRQILDNVLPLYIMWYFYGMYG